MALVVEDGLGVDESLQDDEPNNSLNEPMLPHADGPDGAIEPMLPDGAKPNNDDSDPESRLPPLSSLVSVMLYTFMTTTTFLIAVPTVNGYLGEFSGSPANINGLVIGMAPYASALMNFPQMILLRRYKMKHVLTAFCVVLCCSHIGYALAGFSEQYYTLLGARLIAGCVSGPQILTIYVTKSVGTKKRSAVMLGVGIVVASGYCAGPLASLTLDYICQLNGWTGNNYGKILFTKETAVGWVMAVLTILELCLVQRCFVEPPMLTPPPSNLAQPFPYQALAVTIIIGLIDPICISMWDVGTALKFELDTEFGFSTEIIALVMFAVLITCIPVVYLSSSWLPRVISDRRGILIGLIITLGSSSLLFRQPKDSRSLVLALYLTGSVILVNSLQVGRGFCWAVTSKLAPIRYKPQVMAVNAAVYMFGRGAGATLAPYLATEQGKEDFFAFTMTGCATIGIILLGCNWHLLGDRITRERRSTLQHLRRSSLRFGQTPPLEAPQQQK